MIQLHALSLLQKTVRIRDQFFLYMDPARLILTWEVELGEVGRGFRNGYHSDVISPQVQHLTRRKRNFSVANSLQNFQASLLEKNFELFGPFSALSVQNRPKCGRRYVRPLYLFFGHFWVKRPNDIGVSICSIEKSDGLQTKGNVICIWFIFVSSQWEKSMDE